MARATPVPVVLMDFSGGLNEGLPASALQQNQLSELQNMYPFGSKLVRRNGTKRLTTTSYSETITSLFPVKLQDGSWFLFGGTETGFVKIIDGVPTEIPEKDGSSLAATMERWRTRQRLDVVYAVRAGFGGLKRVTVDGFMGAGIEAPATAPTLTDGGAGTIEAGAYYGVVVFKNTETVCRSNPSLVSAVLNLTANKKRHWANIPVSTNPQVNARELYVTLPNNTGEYFLAATIPNNSSTEWDEDTNLDHLGEPASFSLDLPPPNVKHIELWRERLWLSDGRTLWRSQVAQPEGYDLLDVIEPEDEQESRCLHADGSRLIHGKSASMELITPLGEGRFGRSILSDKHGIIAPDSIKSAEGFVFWYSGDNVYRAVGSLVEAISTVAVRDTLDAVPEADKPFACAAVWPKLSWYLLSVGSCVLVYNYKTGSWAKFMWPSGAAGGEVLNQDPGFESWSGGWSVPTYWTRTWTGGSRIGRVASPVDSGISAVWMIYDLLDPGYAIISQQFQAEAGQNVYLSARAMADFPMGEVINLYLQNKTNGRWLGPAGIWSFTQTPFFSLALGGSYTTLSAAARIEGAVGSEVTMELSAKYEGTMNDGAIYLDNFEVRSEGEAAPWSITEDFDENFEGKLYGTFRDGHAYELHAAGELTDQDNSPIECVVIPKSHARGGPKSAFEYASLLCSNVKHQGTLEAVDADGAVLKSRGIDLRGDGWKEFSFRTSDSVKSQLQLRFSYSGPEHLEIEGLGFGLLDFTRRPVRR